MASEIISTGVGDEAASETDAELVDGLPEPEIRDCDVPASMHGWRIDRALAALVPEFSRSYLQQLMADGAVWFRGGEARKPSAKVTAGDRLRVELRPTQQAMAFVAQPMALDIVFEDTDLLVIRKPAGLVVHPAPGHWSGTLLNGLLAHHAGASSLPRAGIVHRLDKDTSGLMLVAKSRRSMEALVRAIAAREVRREYVALGHGPWERESPCEVERAVGRDPVQRLRMAVLRADQTGAKPARTTVTLIGTNAQACLVACKLHTGRTHQIRVHMAWLGHPLVGDTLYGGKVAWGMERQALHAVRLSLAHPVGGAPLDFTSVPPPDFLAAVAAAGLHYNGPLPG
ncbi:RluA family pseudouridine synthase [Hydrogenophaga sp. MI9]|uniref:RluA family pseudouridine synthase n=1 Tax=Hydrogenophaga sp. MI9 TaxID=3453719 RepID=UPI003EEA374C